MRQNSIKKRLVATVVLSQALLAIGLLLAGIFYTHRRLLATLDAGMQARATSVAALVRYKEDPGGDVYFDNTLLPQSLDLSHPDLFAVWADRELAEWAGSGCGGQQPLEFRLGGSSISRIAPVSDSGAGS
jgi:hypothetical protein